MSDMVPEGLADHPAAMEGSPAKKHAKKPAGVGRAGPKPLNSSVSRLITEVLSVSKGRAGVSLASLKKVLASSSFDAERSYIRMKLGLRSLMGKGTLLRTKSSRASGSSTRSKNVTLAPAKRKGKPASAKTKRPLLSQDPKSSKAVKKTNSVKKQTKAKRGPGSGRKTKGPKVEQRPRSPAKTAKAGKPQLGQRKAERGEAASEK